MQNAPRLLPPPLTLYVHYPWCVRKCPYCDFNSHTQRTVEEAAYFDALIRQLEQTLPLIWGRRIHAVFFGGGTPSLMASEHLTVFLSKARALLGFGAEVEVTLEANPGTAEAEKFASFRAAGVNRLSIGVQSFDDAQLHTLGRIHSSAEAHAALEMARAAGFDNFNIDLMFALPGQTVDAALADIEAALAHGPTHLSHYQLTLEPNTPFYRQPPPGLLDDDAAATLQQACGERLTQAGFHRYEVSAWAQPGHACRHNLNYWHYGDYIGLGAGAHGKLTLPERNEIVRTQMPASPGAYVAEIQRGGMGRQQVVAVEERPFEYMLNRLRLFEPFELAAFEAATGVSRDAIRPTLTALVNKGLLRQEGEALALTEWGQAFLNDVIEAFL